MCCRCCCALNRGLTCLALAQGLLEPVRTDVLVDVVVVMAVGIARHCCCCCWSPLLVEPRRTRVDTSHTHAQTTWLISTTRRESGARERVKQQPLLSHCKVGGAFLEPAKNSRNGADGGGGASNSARRYIKNRIQS